MYCYQGLLKSEVQKQRIQIQTSDFMAKPNLEFQKKRNACEAEGHEYVSMLGRVCNRAGRVYPVFITFNNANVFMGGTMGFLLLEISIFFSRIQSFLGKPVCYK